MVTDFYLFFSLSFPSLSKTEINQHHFTVLSLLLHTDLLEGNIPDEISLPSQLIILFLILAQIAGDWIGPLSDHCKAITSSQTRFLKTRFLKDNIKHVTNKDVIAACMSRLTVIVSYLLPQIQLQKAAPWLMVN